MSSIYFSNNKERDITKKDIEIVVARYNENLNWLNHYFKFITVYNKGNSRLCDKDIKLDNIGRESHTYLTHIIDNWDNLSEKTFFCQGYINDHATWPIYKYLFNNRHLTINLDCHQSTCYQFWGHLIINDPKYLNSISYSPYTFGQWWDKYVKKKKPFPNDFKWGSGAIFSVSKSLIKENSLEYYQNLRDSLRNCQNPEEGHYFERSWFYIFNQGVVTR